MDFLQKLNHAVKHLDKDFAPGNTPPPCIFIIGVPRSGTTLISQLLSGCTDVGYVNNLMARFWQAPVVGARLSKEVLHRRIFTGSSDFGQTKYAEEPHEFGAFWRGVLNYQDMVQKKTDEGIDWESLAHTLKQISTVFEKPVVYKVFQLYWHLENFHRFLPSSKWIWIKRDPAENALSLLQMRQEKTGGLDNWFSARPLGAEKYDNEPVWVQVAAQVKLIEDWIEGQLAKIPAEASLRVSLDELCQNPEGIIKSISSQINVPIFEENLRKAAGKIELEHFDKELDIHREKIEEAFRTCNF